MKAQVDLLASAKQGDLPSLTALMNKPLEPKGIVVSLSMENHCLKIVAEAPINPPAKHSLISFIKQGLDTIMPAGVYSVLVHGKVLGLRSIDWHQHFSLRDDEPQSFVTPEQLHHLSSEKEVPKSSPAITTTTQQPFRTPSRSLPVPSIRASQKPRITPFLWANALMLGGLLGVNIVGWFMPQAMARTEWEYHILTIEDEDFSAAIGALGLEGWELSYARRAIASENDSEYSLYEVIFKRPR